MSSAVQPEARVMFGAISIAEILVSKARESSGESIGERLARLRKERGLTQVELAQKLELTQPVISQYENGELRLHGELIVQLTQILGVTADELLGLHRAKSQAAMNNRRLLRRIQGIDSLSKRDQQALLRTIDAFISKSA